VKNYNNTKKYKERELKTIKEGAQIPNASIHMSFFHRK
jgi:hypothetical protein